MSSAIASNLALGEEKTQSIILAKEYVTGALKDMLDLGKGSGPLNHCYRSNLLGAPTKIMWLPFCNRIR